MSDMKPSRLQRFTDFASRVLYEQEGAILDFTEQIVDVMQQKKMRRKELAERIGKTKPYITQVLQGTTNFSFRTAVLLAMAVGKKLRITLVDESEIDFLPLPRVSPQPESQAGAVVLSIRSSMRWISKRAAPVENTEACLAP